MDIGIIGGSAAGLYSAIFIKKSRPDFRVRLFEKGDRLGKKLSATGNGHCNLLNRDLSPRYYHDSPIANNVLSSFPYLLLEQSLTGIGVSLMANGELVYPLSYHAPSYVKFLLDTAFSLGVEINLNSRFVSYSTKKGGFCVAFDDKTIQVDKLIFATGGKSQKKFGSDGQAYEELSKHGYEIAPLLPGLCPIKVKEKVSSLSGLRHKASVGAFGGAGLLYRESGEVLFKDDGLSGIAIMNASSYLIRETNLAKEKGVETEVVLDLFPANSLASLTSRLLQAYEASRKYFLDCVLERPLKEYVLARCGLANDKEIEEKDVSLIAATLKSLRFHYLSNYGFDQSQVTIGGITHRNLGEGLESKAEPGVYFVGEILDVDGLCGGYNLSFALASSLMVAAKI